MNKNRELIKAKRIAAIVYMLFMLFIVGGTYLSDQQKATIKNENSNFMP